MYLKNLKLKKFRNYEDLDIDFNQNINLFYGNNAQGKTNIIEAIYICALGKSFRTTKDKEAIKYDDSFFSIELTYNRGDRDNEIRVVVSEDKKIAVNGVRIKKLSELISRLNVVIFSPNDISLVNDGPARRRKFIDILIGQLKPNYVHILNQYNQVLSQRNAQLKEIVQKKLDDSILDIWDENLANLAQKIYNYRRNYIEKINCNAKKIHSNLTDNTEVLNLEYLSNCKNKEEIIKKLKKNRSMDIAKMYTSVGIHKDDILITLENREAKIYASQGQRRTITLSLKLAELSTIYEELGEYPIFLLDDFMSELDKKRIKNFIEKIKDIQVVITCTDKLEIKKENKVFYVNNGKIKEEVK